MVEHKKKPPLPAAALGGVGRKKVTGTHAPVSRPTPGGSGGAGKRPPRSPRMTSLSPMPGAKGAVHIDRPDNERKKKAAVEPGTPPPARGKGNAESAKKRSKAMRKLEMCPKCGTIVPKGVVKHGGENSIGTFSINPKDLKIDTSKVLGEGGFGVVYLGDYQATEVAVKVMLGDTKPDEDDIADWKKEVEIMTHLRHPNILAILGAVFDGDKIAIVTEYCAKGSLRKVAKDIARGARMEVTWAKKLDWLIQVAKGMAFLHHKQIHHRDLKASNVFVSGDTMKIADFGLSIRKEAVTSPSIKPASSSPPEVADAKPDASGTFAFVAPEVWKGKPYCDGSDVYAFGVMIIELVTTRIPFDDVPEEEEEKWALRIRRGSAKPVLPRVWGGDPVPDTLRRIVSSTLSFSPSSRPDFRKVVRLLSAELDETYAFSTCPVPYESDDEGEDEPVEEYDGYDSPESSEEEAEGWSRGEY